MRLTHMPPIQHPNGQFTKMRMHLQPKLPIPVNYASAAIPTYAPFGTEYTPEQSVKIVGGRCILIPQSVANMPKLSYKSPQSITNIPKISYEPPQPITNIPKISYESPQPTANIPQISYELPQSVTNVPKFSYVPFPKTPDPAVAPTKPIQHLNETEGSRLHHQPTGRYDTTYNTEYIRRNRQPDQFTQPTRQFTNVFNQYSVLPKIPANNNQTETSDRKSVIDNQPQQPQPAVDNEDAYLPTEPILLTDYEEERLAEQIRTQLGGDAAVDKLKLLYQELAAYDPETTNCVHYSIVRSVAYQLGVFLADDTFRFAISKFVASGRPRGFINYEDMIRYFGRCISSISPNQYEYQQQQQGRYSPQRQMRPNGGGNFSKTDNKFDPDETQIRNLLKQNLKQFELDGTIDFNKLMNELNNVDRNQSGVLNRQQIEEVVYKVRIPLQRSLTYQILERHCRAYPKLYNWRAFVQYLQERIFDLQQIQDRSSPIFTQYTRSRHQWLDDLQKELNEKNRLRIIDRFMSNVANNERVRLESTYPNGWFTRFLRLANAMYTHRTNTNGMQDFLLPREEARRLLRAYNQVWDLQIDENKIQRAFDAHSRNGYVVINGVLKELAK